MNKRNKSKTKGNTWIFLLLIGISTIFMSIGYAAINAITLNLDGTILAQHQEGVFITDVVYEDNTNPENVSFYQTVLNSSVALSDTDVNSTITYKITVYNKNNVDFRFVNVTYDEEFYDNDNITFDLTGIERGDRILSKDYLSFSITFKYVDGINIDEESFNNVLHSYLNFNFERDATPVLANKMVPTYYESGEWKKTDTTSIKWHDYYNAKWANAVTYNNNLVYNQAQNDTEIKVFNGTSDYITLGSANYSFGNNITLVSRFKISEYGTGTQIMIGNIESGGFYLGLNASNKVRFRVFQDASTSQNLYSQEQIDLDTWYTVVLTYDGAIMQLYINGVLEDSLEYTADIFQSAAPIAIGGNPKEDGTVNGSWFKGVISDIIIMKEPLTETEIFKNYGETLTHIPTSHNVLYYLKFDGDNGIVCNGAEYQDDGMIFDGVDDYVSVGYSSYDFNNTFSIGARVKLNAYSEEEYTIFGNPQSAGFNLFKSTDNKFTVSVYDANTSDYVSVETSYVPELDTWYTLMATYDGSELSLYVNGAKHASTATDLVMKVCTTPFMISVNANLNSKLGGCYFNGVISDVILVDEALTANQISTYYSSNVRAVVSDKTLISYDLRAYESRENGTTVPDEMINTMWVWIPRFSATTPTSLEVIDTEIVALGDTAHDAFTFGETELEGFWIGKFENSTNFNSENSENTIYIKPNKSSWTNNSIGSMFNTIKNMTSLRQDYGFDTNDTKSLDTHLIKNNEWAAVAYFAQGNCGVSQNGTYTEIEENTSSYITGGSNYKTNTGQSTTGNVYGVYDMAGGASEFVMANYNDTTNSYLKTLPDSKYYNKYTTAEEYLNNKLQHALFETNDFYNQSTQNFINSTNIWLNRNNLFSYDSSSGESNSSIGSRAILVVK